MALTLDEAIETALLNNPSLRADFAKFEAAALRVPQVSELPDPRVTYTQFVQSVQTRTGEQQFIASVSQAFPWFGELRLQGRIAKSEAMQVLQDYRAQMLDVRRDVTQAWHRLAYEQAAETLALEDKETLESSLDAAAALYSTGQRTRGALLKAQTELARVENDLIGYPARIAALHQELGRLLYVDQLVAVPPLNSGGGEPMALPSAEDLIAEAYAFRPEIERYRLREKQAILQHDLAQKDYYPDFSLGLNYIGIGSRPDNPMGAAAPDDEGEDAWNVAVGFNIPLPNARRRAAKQQAVKQREEAEWRRIATETKVAEEIRSVSSRLRSLEAQLRVLEDNLLPLAAETYSTNQAAYTSSQATFLDLLDAQRTLIAVRRDLLQTRRDYLLATAELERAAGGTLTSSIQKDKP